MSLNPCHLCSMFFSLKMTSINLILESFLVGTQPEKGKYSDCSLEEFGYWCNERLGV